MTAVLLAHQGGWDELLLVAGPIAVFAVLLAVANRRARRLESEQAAANPEAGQEDAAQEDAAQEDAAVEDAAVEDAAQEDAAKEDAAPD